MRKMNERAWGLGKSAMVVLLAAVAVAAGVVLTTCSVHGFADGGGGASLPADLASPGTGGSDDGGVFEGETSEADADGNASLSMAFVWADGAVEGAARSVTGADKGQIQDGVGSLRNCYQLILVDLSSDVTKGRIWDFDEVYSTEKPRSEQLTVGFLTGRTYAILVLMGHKNGPDDAEPPTLLASGYLEKELVAGVSNLEIPTTPIVVGAEFAPYAAQADVRQVGRLAKTVGLDAGKGYTLSYTLGSKAQPVEGRRDDELLRVATEDGLLPLRLADKAVAHEGENWVLADEIRLVENFAMYSPGAAGAAGAAVRLNDMNDHPSECVTTGVARYFVEAGEASDAVGSVFFNMVYAPFGLEDFAADWKDADKFSNSIEALPRWVIRNGLSDALPNENTDFALYGKKDDLGVLIKQNANGNGAISVGVVPAVHRYGVFEDNNPWPIAGTEGQLGAVARIDAWLESYYAAECSQTGDMGKEGRGKYGLYTRYDEGHPGGAVVADGSDGGGGGGGGDGGGGGGAVTGILLNKSSASIAVGGSEPLAATVLPTDAADRTVAWSSNNTGVATVANGTVTGVSAGAATITATAAGGMTATCAVTVTASGGGESESITVTPAAADVTKGKTLQFSASASVTWSVTGASAAGTVISPSGLLTVSATEQAVGHLIVTATATGGVSGTAALTVYDPTTRITVSAPGRQSVAVGATKVFTAVVEPATANPKALWTVSPNGFATIAPSGAPSATATVTGVASGSVKVAATAADDGNVKGEYPSDFVITN
jgi:hypothetical protein